MAITALGSALEQPAAAGLGGVAVTWGPSTKLGGRSGERSQRLCCQLRHQARQPGGLGDRTARLTA